MKYVAAVIVIIMFAISNEIISLMALSVLGVMGLYRIMSDRRY